MTVSIPSNYDAVDVNSEGGILFGLPIQQGGAGQVPQPVPTSTIWWE
jgi:hypothetical protein